MVLELEEFRGGDGFSREEERIYEVLALLENSLALLLVYFQHGVEGGLGQLQFEVIVGDAGEEVVDHAAEVGKLLGVGGDLQKVVYFVEYFRVL